MTDCDLFIKVEYARKAQRRPVEKETLGTHPVSM